MITKLTAYAVLFADQDTPKIAPVACYLHWKVGLTPSTAEGGCANESFHALIPDETYKGVRNFVLNLTHSYRDDRYDSIAEQV